MFDIANNTEFLTAIGVNDAPEDVKAQLIADIEELAQQRLIVKISDKITNEQAEEFNSITDEQQAADQLKANIPGFDDFVTEVFAEIRDELLAEKANKEGEQT